MNIYKVKKINLEKINNTMFDIKKKIYKFMKKKFNLKIWPQLIGEKWKWGDFNKVNCNIKNSERGEFKKVNCSIKIVKQLLTLNEMKL